MGYEQIMPAIVEMRLRPSRGLEPTTRQMHGLATRPWAEVITAAWQRLTALPQAP
jgi:hypothetical protein